MSASTENLLEQIKKTEEMLVIARRDGHQPVIVQCEADLKKLRRSLNSANEALTEGKQNLLKG
jgi:hypothetical protein